MADRKCVVVEVSKRRWVVAEPTIEDNTYKVVTRKFAYYNDALKVCREINELPGDQRSAITKDSILEG